MKWLTRQIWFHPIERWHEPCWCLILLLLLLLLHMQQSQPPIQQNPSSPNSQPSIFFRHYFFMVSFSTSRLRLGSGGWNGRLEIFLFLSSPPTHVCFHLTIAARAGHTWGPCFRLWFLVQLCVKRKQSFDSLSNGPSPNNNGFPLFGPRVSWLALILEAF